MKYVILEFPVADEAGVVVGAAGEVQLEPLGRGEHFVAARIGAGVAPRADWVVPAYLVPGLWQGLGFQSNRYITKIVLYYY